MNETTETCKPTVEQWTCDCGSVNSKKFCAKCGKPRPKAAPIPERPPWTCPKCGQENKGKFCIRCAEPKPGVGARWKCENCGKYNTAKYCIGCGMKKQEVVVLFSADETEI